MTIWNLDIGCVRVVGTDATRSPPAELRAQIEVAVRNALESAPLPNGRAVKASVQVNVNSLSDGAAIARAVASGVSQAVGGRAHG